MESLTRELVIRTIMLTVLTRIVKIDVGPYFDARVVDQAAFAAVTAFAAFSFVASRVVHFVILVEMT